MRIFLVSREEGTGLARPALPGESLGDFISSSCRPGGWAPEMLAYWDEDAVIRPRRWTDEERELIRSDACVGYRDPDREEWLAPELPEAGFIDDDHVMVWIEMEVPDETRFIYHGGCWPDLSHYCGIGGEGFVRVLGV